MAITWEKAVADYKNNAGSSTASTPVSGGITWKQAAAEFKKYGSDDYAALGQKRIAERQQEIVRRNEQASVLDWMDRYNRVMQGVSEYDTQRNGGYTQDASGGYSRRIESLIADYEGIKGLADLYGFQDSQKYLDQLKDLQKSVGEINDSFSQFEDEDAYNRYMEYWQDQEEKKNLDLDAYSWETAALEKQLADYAPEFDWTDKQQRDAVDAEIQRMQDEINQRKQYLAQAQRVQKKEEYSSVADPESEQYDAAFDSKSRYVSTEQDSKLQRMLSQYSMGYGDLTYEYINNQNGIRDQIKKKASAYSKGETPFEAKGYDYMTEDEIGLYNYYYSMGGKASAEAYLDTIQEDLNQRKAVGMYQPLEGKTGAEMIFGVEAGLDQFKGGIKGAVRAVKGDGSYVAPSAHQYASQMVREDLADDGIKLPAWLGGASLGQVGYDAITTTANMAPSIAVGMLNPTLGTAALGISAGGSAYQEALNEGFSVDQARGYGILSGASEIIMEKLLGGISAYGGNALGKFFTQNMRNADSALRRIAKEIGGSVLSEFGEEYLQEVLTPVFRNLTLGTDEEVKLVSAEALYAGFLGAITGGLLEGPQAIANGRNATAAPNNATELAKNASPELSKATVTEENSTPGGVTEQPAAADNKMSATEAVAKNATTTVGVSKMETVQQTADIESFSQQFGTQADAVRRNYMEGQDLQEYEVGFQTAYAMGLEGGKKEALGAVPYLSQSQREIAFSLGRDAAAAQKAAAPKKAAVTARMTTEEGTQDVTIVEVVGMDDTTMTFRLEDGRTVTDDDLNFDNGQQLLSAAWDLGMDVASVNTILQESAGTSASDAALAAGIQQAHHYGIHGYTMEQLTQHGSDASVLTDGQRKAAWEAGRKIYLQQAEAPATTAKAPRTSGVWFDNGGGDVIAFDDYDVSGVSKAAVAGVRAAQVLQKLGIGHNFYFFESYENEAGERVYKDENGVEKKAPNGWYDPADGSIHIDLNAGADGKGLTMYTLSHELTHFVEKWSPKKYQALADFLVANYAKAGNVDAIVAEKQAELSANRGTEVSYEEAYSEFIADSMEAMLSDGNVLEKLQELKKTDKSLFDKTREFFDNLAKKIREIYKDLTPDSLEGQAVLQMKDQIEQIQQLFAEALAEAGENFQAADGQKNTAHKERQLSDRYPSNQITEQDRKYLDAVNRGDMVAAQRMVDEAAKHWGAFLNNPQANEVFPQSGEVRTFYHGTNTGEFTVFDKDLFGNSSGDLGWFGKGFYFAFSAEEAETYGKRVVNAYLKMKNPYDYSQLYKFKGSDRGDSRYSRFAWLYNIVKQFPEIVTGQKIYAYPNDTDDGKAVSWNQVADWMDRLEREAKFSVAQVELSNGETAFELRANPKQESFTNDDGETFTWTEYGMRQMFATEMDAKEPINQIGAYLVNVMGVEPVAKRAIEKIDFSGALQKAGYDGILQSPSGDEAVVFDSSQIKLSDTVTYDDDGNIIPLSKRFDPQKKDIRYSDRKKPGEYGGIREVLAKKGLDELSVKLGDCFPLSAKFDETMRNDGTELVMENVAANSVVKGRKESAYKVGRKAFTSKYGAKTSVHIAQMGIDADLYADVANESINKAIGNPDEQSTLDVIPHIDKILSNSVLMGVERIAHTDKKGTALFGYRLYNLYWYVDGNKKTPHALVCTVIQDLNKAEGYVFKNIENVTIGRGLPGTNAGMSSPVNGDTYTVAQLYDAVKKIDRNDGGLKYSADDRNTYLFSYTEREDGVAYQDRSTGTSNRALLAGAFEELATSPDELKFIRDYQENVGKLNEQEAKLQEIRMEIREISFGKGPRDSKRLQQLQEEATKTANRIDIYDKKLLKLERAKPLRDVLDREREKVQKRTRQKGQEALESYREKRKESAAKKDARRKIRKAIMDLNKLLNRGDKKKHVKDGMTAMVGKTLKLAEALFMDEYTNRDMLRNGVGVELTDAEEAIFQEARQMMESIESGAAIEGMEFASEIDAMEQMKKLDQKLSSKMAGLKDVFARERKRLYGTTVSDLLGQLADEYNRLSEAEDGAVRAAKDENVYAHLLQLKADVGGTTVRDMTLGQMEAVADAFTMVLTTVRNANKLFAKNIQFKRDTLAGMVMAEIRAAAKKKGILEKPWEHAKDTFFWNNLKPVYAFARLGSETLRTLYQNIRKGQDTWAVDMQEADAFRREQYQKHNRKNWDLEKQHSFEFESGKVQLSLEQIMSLYAYSRREQALDHLLKGGFVFSGSTEVIEAKNGIKRRYLKKDSTAYNLTADELMQVIDTLNAEQKLFVEEMQTYLSDVMGGKGNEVSLQMYGIKSFGEKNYFPLRSAGQYMEKAKEDSFRKEQGQISIVNSGFTKAVAPKANNPITLDGFMDVWAEHVNDMSMYHSFVLPMEDFRRVYNYSTPNVEEGNSLSVNATIENAHGKAATAYIDQLYKDLNGGAVSDNRENLSKKLVGLHKKAAVFASASVVIQQPSAIVRAFAVIDPKHFIGPKVDHKRHKMLWEEVKKYAPVAFVKEMGYFDTGMGRSAKDYLQAEEYSGIREKAKALFKDSDYRDEILGKAPALADEITWCSIWEAVKRETKARNPGMDPKGDAFLQIAGERFSEVIDKTQVYDSVLSRSANMRSKALHMNMLTSFMAEPTTSINMLEDALRSGDRKQLKRTVGAVYGSVLLNSLLVSLVYAARDDDEDETYWEKYLSSVAVEMVDGLNPITYYPFLRDIWSIGQGFDVERADMSLISDFADAAKNVISAGMKLRNAEEGEEAAAMEKFKDSLWSMTDTVASLTGLPVKNIRRDIDGARNLVKTISKDLAGRKATDLSLLDAVLADVMNSIPIGNLLYGKSKRDRLYGAIMAGDTVYTQRLRAGYESDNAYHSAIKLALRENDSRIWEAAVAWNDGDMETYIQIAKEIRGENRFTQDDIVLAIRAEASSMEEKESSSSSKKQGYFTAEKFGVAAGQDNTAMADMIRQDLIDTAVANGKTQEEAESSFQGTAREQMKKQYMSGSITGGTAEKLLMRYGGFDRESASGKVTQWQYEKDHPELDGRITYTQYKRWEADGKSRGVSLDLFTEVAEYQDSGTSGSNRSQTEVAGYINRLPISTAQKDALWCCFWKESTLNEKAPWH